MGRVSPWTHRKFLLWKLLTYHLWNRFNLHWDISNFRDKNRLILPGVKLEYFLTYFKNLLRQYVSENSLMSHLICKINNSKLNSSVYLHKQADNDFSIPNIKILLNTDLWREAGKISFSSLIFIIGFGVN